MNVGDNVLIQSYYRSWESKIVGEGMDTFQGTKPVFHVPFKDGIAHFYQNALPDGRHLNVGNKNFWIVSPSRIVES